MLIGNFAVLDKESLNLLKSIVANSNIRLLTSKETEFARYDETFNPFDQPDYWIMVNKFSLKTSNLKAMLKNEAKFAYIKLITLREFKKFDFNKPYSEFVNLFLSWSSAHKHRVLGHLELETQNQFINRCKSKFNSDFIYCITPRISSPVHKNDTISQNDKSLLFLKDLVMELCNRLEKHNHSNYLIEPEITRLNDAISDIHDADHSWGDRNPMI